MSYILEWIADACKLSVSQIGVHVQSIVAALTKRDFKYYNKLEAIKITCLLGPGTYL
jgi:hypothetical protein